MMKLINPIISKRFFVPTAYPSDFGCGSLLKQILNWHQLHIPCSWEWLLYQRYLFHAYGLDLTDIELMEIIYTSSFKLCWLELSAPKQSGTNVLVSGCKAKKT